MEVAFLFSAIYIRNAVDTAAATARPNLEIGRSLQQISSAHLTH